MSLHIHSANYQKKHRASDIFALTDNEISVRRVKIHINEFQMSIKKFLSVLAILCCFSIANAHSNGEGKDSVGTKVKNGKVFIMHKVEKGQGLYSIGRRYGVPYKTIMAANPGTENQLFVGQIVLVPTGKDAPMEEKVVKEYFEEKKPEKEEKVDPRIKENDKTEVRSTFAKYHTVQSGETLYAIAKKYKTNTKVLMDLNEMTNTALSVGQRILVPVEDKAGAKQAEKTKELEEKLEQVEEETTEVKEEIERRKNDKTNPVAQAYSKKVDEMPEFDVKKITETGNLQFSDENELSSNKKVASHHEAEIGTTIMITNPVNNKAIFVKVVKNHSMDSNEANMIIIPGAVASKIGIQNGQSVTTSYAR